MPQRSRPSRRPPSRARRAALIALDQISGVVASTSDQLLPLLGSDDHILRNAAWWIAARRPEWGGELAGFFRKRLEIPSLSAAERDDLGQKLTPFTSHVAIQQLLAERCRGQRVNRDAAYCAPRDEGCIFNVGACVGTAEGTAGRLGHGPRSCAARGRRRCGAPDCACGPGRAGPEGRGYRPRRCVVPSRAERSRATERRLEALAAVAGNAAIQSRALRAAAERAGTHESCHVARPCGSRAGAGAPRYRNQLVALASSLETVGPLELPRLLQAFDSPMVVRE